MGGRRPSGAGARAQGGSAEREGAVEHERREAARMTSTPHLVSKAEIVAELHRLGITYR